MLKFESKNKQNTMFLLATWVRVYENEIKTLDSILILPLFPDLEKCIW